MPTPTLGILLIVKNEADLLPRCLESVSAADELIVVDTGSTDHSAEIAASCGAKILHHAWAEDFSKARNAGLELASTDWVLVLDADEILVTPVAEIKDILAATPLLACTVRIENHFGPNREDRIIHTAVRLFRTGYGFRYSGRIHESVEPSIIGSHGIGAIGFSAVHLVHTGYLPERMEHTQKLARNERLLRLALAENPDDPFTRYNLAVHCCQTGHLEDAEQLLTDTLARAPMQASYRPTMVRDLGKIELATGKIPQLRNLLADELPRYPDYPDLHVMEGQALESQGLLERAFESYGRAADCGSSNNPGEKYALELGMATFRPLHRMGVLARRLGRHEEAARLFHRSLLGHPLYVPALTGIADVFIHLHAADTAIAGLLTSLVGTDSAAGWASMLEALDSIGAYEAISALPQPPMDLEPQAWARIIAARIGTNKYAEADGMLGKMLTSRTADFANHAHRLVWLELYALSRWDRGLAMEPVPAGELPGLEKTFLHIEQTLLHGPTLPEDHHSGSPPAEFVAGLIRRSVKLRRYTLAAALADRFPGHLAGLAEALYEAGRRAEAGELIITLAREDQLSCRLCHYLGEMLLDKGHYAEAAGWFQRASRDRPEAEGDASRMALAFCYLQQAEQDLREAVQRLGNDGGGSALTEEIESTRQAILLLNRIPWHTEWSSCQRREGSTP
ncbi:glycosyltransferase [Paenibacillus sp. NFR01]|uniref:glycosyltransferase n=1 Tax=Paenibacillus sp. NFR01 TaxID=1566279 RepID=UPI0008AE190A|nr:glycosyltransferase [Paenibacillus sp. NFR01]SEU20213.1 Tetratricopeptide repeat-containing protein [Paenibacillus sp. NFR01]